MKSDHWFFGIFRDCPWLFFRLIGFPESEAVRYRFDAVELKQSALRLDGIFCPNKPEEMYFFLEVQLYKDPEFYRKWMAKVSLYCLQHRVEKWRGLVVFGNRNHEPRLSHGIEEWIGSGRIQLLYLEEIPEYPEVSLEVAVLKLAMATPDKLLHKARELVTEVKKSEASLKEPKRTLEFIEKFLVLNFPRLTRIEIQTMLQLNEIRESTVFQEGLQEGKLEGKLEGVREGILKEKMASIARLHSKGRSVEEIREFLDVDDDLIRKVLSQAQRDS